MGNLISNNPIYKDFKLHPWKYDFHQALALTKKLYPDQKVRFKVPPRLTFNPGTVNGLSLSTEGEPLLSVNLLGLTGADGPLPLWVTELAETLTLRGEPALADFFNLLGDRVINLYQELTGKMKQADRYFLAMSGVLTLGLTGGTVTVPVSGPQGEQAGKLPAASFLSAAQVWGTFPRSANGLEFLAEKAFGVKARVEPLKGAWVKLPEEHRTRLGREKHQLGRDTISGGDVFDPAAGVTLKLGPLTKEEYRSFLPPPAGQRYADLMALVKWYAGDGVVMLKLLLGGE